MAENIKPLQRLAEFWLSILLIPFSRKEVILGIIIILKLWYLFCITFLKFCRKFKEIEVKTIF